MTHQRLQLIRNVVLRARIAMAWLVVVVGLIFAALAHAWRPGTLTGLLFAIGIGAGIALTRVWNLLDEAKELLKLESGAAPVAMSQYSDEPTAFR